MGKVVVIALNNGQLVAFTFVLCWRSSDEIVAQVRQLAFVNSFGLRVMAASARQVATRQFVVGASSTLLPQSASDTGVNRRRTGEGFQAFVVEGAP